jgi:hypothetical protein
MICPECYVEVDIDDEYCPECYEPLHDGEYEDYDYRDDLIYENL